MSINTGGEKVFPEEVEEAVKLHPAVVDALVVGVPDERFGEAITALVALRDGESRHRGRDRRRGARSPRRLQAAASRASIVDAVPRGPNGKADYAWAKKLAVERTT